jgi:hypothetical protein
VESDSLSFGPSHERPLPKRKCPPKCLHGITFLEFWRQEFLFSAQNMGSLDESL